VPLKEHIETRLSSAEKAIAAAKCDLEKRLDGMNEFRQTLSDQATHFITRGEHDMLVEDIRGLRESRAMLQGKADQKDLASTSLIAWISLACGIVSILLSALMIAVVWLKH